MATSDLTPREYTNQREIWKPVVGYEGFYEVSNLGRVKSIRSGKGTYIGRIVRGGHIYNGYAMVNLSKYGIPKFFTVHRLVAFAFLGNPPTPKHEINHKNLIRTDNRVENLEWCTHLENMRHSYRNSNRNQGNERNGNARLTWESVREIRRIYSEGGITQPNLAKVFNVSPTTIWDVVNNKRWKE